MFKYIFLLMIFISSDLFAHGSMRFILEVNVLKNNKIEIKNKSISSKKYTSGHKVQIVSMIDNRILFEQKIQNKSLILDIPKESYWIYLEARDARIIQRGPEPKDGFKIRTQIKEIAFLYTFLLSIFILFLSLIIFIKNKRA